MSHLAQITHFPDQPDGGFQTFHKTQFFTAPLTGFTTIPLVLDAPTPTDEEPEP